MLLLGAKSRPRSTARQISDMRTLTADEPNESFCTCLSIKPEVFCDPDRLAAACVQIRSRGHIKRLLLALTPECQRLALERAPEDFRGYFQAELAKPKMCVGMDGERCTFARGGPVRVKGQATRCLFCRPEDLWPLCDDDAGKREAGPRVFFRAAWENSEQVHCLPCSRSWASCVACQQPAVPMLWPSDCRRQLENTFKRICRVQRSSAQLGGVAGACRTSSSSRTCGRVPWPRDKQLEARHQRR